MTSRDRARFPASAGFDVERYDEGFAAADRDGTVELHLVRPNSDGRYGVRRTGTCATSTCSMTRGRQQAWRVLEVRR